MSHAVCASVARPAVCAALARAARPVSTTKPARPNLVCTRVAEVETSYDNATIDLTISTDEARVCFQFDKAVLNANEGPVIFVTGVAIGCAAETAGVVPGQRLVALSDPINKGELWFLDGTERLAFVLDAIRSTRAYEVTLIFESEVSVTKEMVDKVRPTPTEVQAQAQQAQPKAGTAKVTPQQLGFDRPPPQEKREREDLYSENWEGDEYVGTGFWNELTVGIAIFVGVPGVITLVATIGRGTLWDTASNF